MKKFIIFLTVFVSCTSHQNETKITLYPEVDDYYTIDYKNDYIVLSTKGSIFSDTLFVRDGNVYDSEDRLFFTTEKDTVLYYEADNKHIRTVIMKNNGKENEYKTQIFASGGGLPERLNISYTYNDSYKIIKIQRVVLADYVINNPSSHKIGGTGLGSIYNYYGCDENEIKFFKRFVLTKCLTPCEQELDYMHKKYPDNCNRGKRPDIVEEKKC